MNFQLNATVFIENSFWSVQATVIKQTEKAVQFLTTDNQNYKEIRAWFPKSAFQWREEEEGQTLQLKKWFTKSPQHQYFFEERS